MDKGKIKGLEEIARNIPHLTISIALTPIAVPYAFIRIIANSSVDFFYPYIEPKEKEDKFISFYVSGFENFREAIEEYKTR